MIIPFKRPGRARQVKRNMPDQTHPSELDRLLEYRENLSGGTFVLDVMHRLGRERRRRRLILYVFGLIGAAFGVAGAVLLSGPLAAVFANLPPMGTLQATLFAVAAVAFYAWFMNEDVDLSL
jgi:hypothetical protein